MSGLKAYDEKEERAHKLDELFLRLSTFVCEHGPKLLTLGMDQLEANTAILECLEQLKSRVDVAERNSKDDNEQKAALLRKVQLANKIFEWLDRESWYVVGIPGGWYVVGIPGDSPIVKMREDFYARDR